MGRPGWLRFGIRDGDQTEPFKGGDVKQEVADGPGAATLLVLRADKLGRSGRGRVGRGSRMRGAGAGRTGEPLSMPSSAAAAGIRRPPQLEVGRGPLGQEGHWPMHLPCLLAGGNIHLPHFVQVLFSPPGRGLEGGRRFCDGSGRLWDEVPSSAGGGHRSSAVRERGARPITPAAHPCLRRGPTKQGAGRYLPRHMHAKLQG